MKWNTEQKVQEFVVGEVEEIAAEDLRNFKVRKSPRYYDDTDTIPDVMEKSTATEKVKILSMNVIARPASLTTIQVVRRYLVEYKTAVIEDD